MSRMRRASRCRCNGIRNGTRATTRCRVRCFRPSGRLSAAWAAGMRCAAWPVRQLDPDQGGSATGCGYGSSITEAAMYLLIAYATTDGQTRKIARFAADRLAVQGHSVELLNVEDAEGLDLSASTARSSPGRCTSAATRRPSPLCHRQRRRAGHRCRRCFWPFRCRPPVTIPRIGRACAKASPRRDRDGLDFGRVNTSPGPSVHRVRLLPAWRCAGSPIRRARRRARHRTGIHRLGRSWPALTAGCRD